MFKLLITLVALSQAIANAQVADDAKNVNPEGLDKHFKVLFK